MKLILLIRKESSSKSQINTSDSDAPIEKDCYFSGPCCLATETVTCHEFATAESVLATADVSSGFKKKASQRLPESEMMPCLRSELAEILKFYSGYLNYDCKGGPLQSSKLIKMLERLGLFLWFLKNVKSLEPTLKYCEDPPLMQEFVKYVMDMRDIKAVTCG